MQKEKPKSSWRRGLIRIGGSTVMLTLLLLILPFDEIVEVLRRMPLTIWVAGLGSYLCLHFIGVIKWRLMSNSAGAGMPLSVAARCYYAGLFGNTFLPSIVGGDVVRAGLAFKHVRSKSGLLFGSFIDRLLDFVALIAVAGIGALLLPTALDPQSRRIFVAAAAFVGLLCVGGFAAIAILPVKRLSIKIRRKLVHLRKAMRAIAERPGAVTMVLSLGITLQFTLVLLNAWLSNAVGIHISLAMWLFVWPLAKLSGVLPVTQNGIGVREAAQVVLFAPFGVAAVAAVAAGLVFETIILAGGLVGGALSLIIARLSAAHLPQSTSPASNPSVHVAA
jgi:glycosyltransferase 2 family protein